MATYKIVGPDGRTRQNSDMLAILGLGGSKLPKEGMPEFTVVGVRNFKRGDLNAEIAHITVWVNPVPPEGKRSRSQHRMMCRCPGCSKVLSVGRLHQHVCKEGAK